MREENDLIQIKSDLSGNRQPIQRVSIRRRMGILPLTARNGPDDEKRFTALNHRVGEWRVRRLQ